MVTYRQYGIRRTFFFERRSSQEDVQEECAAVLLCVDCEHEGKKILLGTLCNHKFDIDNALLNELDSEIYMHTKKNKDKILVQLLF